MTEIMLRFTNMGAEWVMYLLAGLSLVSIMLIIERTIYFRTRRVNIDKLTDGLDAALKAGNLQAAQQLVAGSSSIECRVLSAGLGAVHRGLHGVAETMHSTKARERLRLEAFLPVLGTLGNNAPFVGLLGTVIGIIQASSDLAAAQAAKKAAAAAVMGGVFEALVATAVGLFVALPAVVAFNVFQKKAQNSLIRTDVLAHLLISYIKPKTTSGTGSTTPTPESRPVESRPIASPAPPKIPQGV